MTHRYIARIILEAETPIFVGSGESSLLKDALVMKDHNGYPMLLGTSLTGVLRHSFEGDVNELFGFQSGDIGTGSRVIISNAAFMVAEGKCAEGLIHDNKPSFFTKLENLPSRQHVRISDKGAAQKGGLFDNEVVYKGARFIFEIELKGTAVDEPIWNKLIDQIKSPLFRIGTGTRNGYGNLTVKKIGVKIFDLSSKDGYENYRDFDASLNFSSLNIESILPSNESYTYHLSLTPDDFFIFSEGFGDAEVDNKPLEEEIIRYSSEGIAFEKQTIIPGSSLKGAIAHRTAFHYNKLRERFVDELEKNMGMEVVRELYTGSNNKAVNVLFGLGSGHDFSNENKSKIDALDKSQFDEYGDPRRGHVIINDIYLDRSEVNNDKIFNHVAIDRFTGGAMDTALFSEKVSRLVGEKKTIDLYIHLDKIEFENDLIIQSLENTLLDITKGLLPLGGMTTKGNGMFTGSLKKGSELITEYHQNKTNG